MPPVLFAVLLPALIMGLSTAFQWGKRFDLDNAMGPGSFYGIMSVYRRISGAIFLASLPTGFLMADRHAAAPAILLIAAALYSVLFHVWITACYESYLHARYARDGSGHSNYTGTQYAVTLALGYSSVIMFVAGIVSTGLTLGGW